MKVLTKYFKVVLCFMAFALCSFMFAFTPTLTAVQAAELLVADYNVAINALKMPTEEVDYNTPGKDVFKVPLLDSVLGAKSTDYTIRVIDPAGAEHDFSVKTGKNVKGNDKNYFSLDGTTVDNSSNVIINAKNDGEYKIIYIVSTGADEAQRNYYSNTYTVRVTNATYELDFSTPVLNDSKAVVAYTKSLVKSRLAVSTDSYQLPVAYAKITGKELSVNAEGKVTNDVATIKVTKNGAPQVLNDDVNKSIFKSTTGANGETNYYIVPNEAGVYTVEYTFEDSVNRPSKTFTINVEENFEASNLKLASTTTMPTIELGKSVTLPKLTVNAGDQKNVDYNIKSIKIEKEDKSSIYKVLDENVLTFTMSPDEFEGVADYKDMVGNYIVTYNLEDAYGKTLTETFKVNGVTVSSKPTIKLAYNFNTSNLDDVVFGAETELKAEYVNSDAGLILPAVYVEDAVTKKYEDFLVVRRIRKGSTYYYLDNLKYNEDTNSLDPVDSSDRGYNASGDTNIGKTNKAVKFKFNTNATNTEGTFYLEYEVITPAVVKRQNSLKATGTTSSYSFKIVSSHSKTTPTVEITNLKDSAVKNTEKITVKLTSTDTVDTRLKNAVFTYSSKKGGVEGSLSEILTEVIDNIQNAPSYEETCNILDDQRIIDGIPNDQDPTKSIKGLKDYFNDIAIVKETETKNNFDLDLSGKTGKVTVAAVALNDDAQVAVAEKVLTIKNTADDEYPEIKIVKDTLPEKWQDKTDPTNIKVKEFTVGQGETITLPSVYVQDEDKSLSLNVSYYVDSPENSYGGIKYLSPVGKRFYYSKSLAATEVQVVDGGSIVTSETGVYYVAYSATDVAGNTSVMYFTFVVEDTSNPILTVNPVSDNVTIAGNTITGGKGAVVDFETTLKSADGKLNYTEDAEINITIDDGNKGLDYQPSGNSRTSYVFNSYGTYYVTISAKYDKGTVGTEDDLIANDKLIKVVIEKQPIEWLGEFDVPEYAAKNSEVKLPNVIASNGAKVKVTYVTPGNASSEAVDAELKTDENGYTYWSFTTHETSKGTYTVTYTATTEEDVLTKTFSVKVGDNVGPVLTFNKGDLVQDLVYDGENDIEYILEVNKSKKTFVVKVVNGGEEIYSQNIALVISDKDDTGSVNSSMTWANLTYELTGKNVTKGDSSTTSGTTTTKYIISETGKYTLKLSTKDNYDNESQPASIEFNVVEKTAVKENKDNVVGAVLIVVSLVLLAGVILFFTLTGKNGGNKSFKKSKTSKEKNEVKATKEEKEEVAVVEKVDEEPKTGDVE